MNSDDENDLELLHDRGESDDENNPQIIRDQSDDDDVQEARDDEAMEVGGDGDGDQGGDGAEEEKGKKVEKPKRKQAPRPKFNAETLKSSKGLTALPELFRRQKFKGHGHEAEDLCMMLKTYEYWCHRLFPKFTFDESVKHIENLGYKKPVVTLIKKIRYDMLEPDYPKQNVSEDEDKDKDEDDVPVNDPESEVFPPPQASQTIELTDAQREQIRLNRERALRIRRERMLQKLNETTQQSRSQVLQDANLKEKRQSDDHEEESDAIRVSQLLRDTSVDKISQEVDGQIQNDGVNSQSKDDEVNVSDVLRDIDIASTKPIRQLHNDDGEDGLVVQNMESD